MYEDYSMYVQISPEICTFEKSSSVFLAQSNKYI